MAASDKRVYQRRTEDFSEISQINFFTVRVNVSNLFIIFAAEFQTFSLSREQSQACLNYTEARKCLNFIRTNNIYRYEKYPIHFVNAPHRYADEGRKQVFP